MMSEAKIEQGETGAIREALREVIDPEIGMNVLDLGFIREIDVTDDAVHIKMILTTPFCPMAQMLVSQVKRAAEKVVDRPVEVTLGDEPWHPSMMKRQDEAA